VMGAAGGAVAPRLLSPPCTACNRRAKAKDLVRLLSVLLGDASSSALGISLPDGRAVFTGGLFVSSAVIGATPSRAGALPVLLSDRLSMGSAMWNRFDLDGDGAGKGVSGKISTSTDSSDSSLLPSLSLLSLLLSSPSLSPLSPLLLLFSSLFLVCPSPCAAVGVEVVKEEAERELCSSEERTEEECGEVWRGEEEVGPIENKDAMDRILRASKPLGSCVAMKEAIRFLSGECIGERRRVGEGRGGEGRGGEGRGEGSFTLITFAV
jgi:hypothetical protein